MHLARKCKPLLPNKSNKSLTLLDHFLNIVLKLTTAPSPDPCSIKITKLFHNFKRPFEFQPGQSSAVCLLICTCLAFKLAFLFQSTSTTSLMHPCLKTGRGWNYCLHPFWKHYKLAFFIFTNNHHFPLLNFYL